MASDLFIIKEHILPCSHIREYPRATSSSQEDVLHLHIKQYTPRDNPDPQPGDLTIIGAHANGFSKELYEPLWCDLHRSLATRSTTTRTPSNHDKNPSANPRPLRIRGIWIADVAHQGQSSLLNTSKPATTPPGTTTRATSSWS